MDKLDVMVPPNLDKTLDGGIRGYDANVDGTMDRDEANVAVSDYFNEAIGRDEVIEVIRLYFSS